jgi:hypothetical protein
LLVEPPREILPLLQEKRNLGRNQAEVHHYRLSELELKQGAWSIDRSFDLRPEKPPQISKPIDGASESSRGSGPTANAAYRFYLCTKSVSFLYCTGNRS